MKTKLATALLAGLLAGMPAHAAMLAPGVPFPAWKLRDQTGAEVSSADLTGKTYLLWYYPKAMTPGCTAEGISLRDRYDDFRSLDLLHNGRFDANRVVQLVYRCHDSDE